MIKLIPTQEDDLDLILKAEQAKENSSFICSSTLEKHQALLNYNDIDYFTVKSKEDDRFVGYVILAGKTNVNNSIELRRIVITEKGKGYGRQCIQFIKKYSFEQLKAHRLWLDVFEDNRVGRKLYTSEGFIVEGVLRESLLSEGAYRSQIVMSILAKEYFKADD